MSGTRQQASILLAEALAGLRLSGRGLTLSQIWTDDRKVWSHVKDGDDRYVLTVSWTDTSADAA